MASEIVVPFDQAPSLLSLYRRILFSRRPGLKPGEALPLLVAEWKGVSVEAEGLKKYCAATGLEEDGCLPILFPHVLTAPVHMTFIAHKDFPLSPLGALHLRNHILQHEAIGAGEKMNVKCRLADSRVVKSGLEFDVQTAIHVDGPRKWESIATYFVRGKKFGEAGEPPAIAGMAELGAPNTEAAFHVPKNMGRHYAGIARDYNPIHISKILAKLFGFKRDIIHGMWSAAKAMSQLPGVGTDGPLRHDLAFKGPIFMDSDVTVKAEAGDAGVRFDLFCGKNPRPSMCGHVRREEAGTVLFE